MSNIASFPCSPWESKHGGLLGMRAMMMVSTADPENPMLVEVRQAALRLLTHQEVRVRGAAG